MFVSEAAGLASRAAERPRGTKNARQIAGRDYEHSSTCQARACKAVVMSVNSFSCKGNQVQGRCWG